MRYLLCFCAVAAAYPAAAADMKAPAARASFGSAKTVDDIKQCLASKLAVLGDPVASGVAPTTSLTYGQGKDKLIVEIMDGGDVRLVTVDAVRKLGPRQDEIRSCLY